MKDELEKKKKVNKLKEYAKAASTANLPEMASKTIGKVTKGVNAKEIASQVGGKSIGQVAGDMLKKSKKKDLDSINEKKANQEKYRNLSKEDKIKVIKAQVKKSTSPGGKDFNDANVENQLYKRYEKVGVSPIYSHGAFDRTDKEQDEKLGNRITEDDKVPETSKKRNKRQY